MINKIYRFIFVGSLMLIGVFIPLFVSGSLFFNNYNSSPSMLRAVELLAPVVPFAPIGTLFGTLKGNQSTQRKMLILFATGGAVILLLVFVWGTMVAATFAK